MGKVAWDLECRNPECENPTRLDDVRAETKPDGTVVIEGADGADVNAVCESCRGKLSKVLGKVNIGGGRPGRLESPDSSRSFDETFCRVSGFKKLHSSGGGGVVFENTHTGLCHEGNITSLPLGEMGTAHCVKINKTPIGGKN